MRSRSSQDIYSEAGTFATVNEARRAVQGLLVAGFTTEHITVVCSADTKLKHFREFEHQKPAGTNTTKAVITGGVIGAVIGGTAMISAALAADALALWVAGPIGSVAVAVVGGLVGAMLTRGVEKELANYYQQAVPRGRILVAAEHTGPLHRQRLAEAAQVLADAGAQPRDMGTGTRRPRPCQEVRQEQQRPERRQRQCQEQ